MAFPEDSIQYVLDDWWETAPKGSPKRGDLIRTLVPFRFGLPTCLLTKRRADQPGDHERVDFESRPFGFDAVIPKEKLPIAGLPHIEGGSYMLLPFKKRPALVLASPADPPDESLTLGLAGYQKTPCFIVAPYYGADKNGERGGYPDDLVQLVRRCKYPQYFWDCLPLIGDTTSSLLRIDAMFPVVYDRNWYRHTGYRLTPDGMEIMAEYIEWFMTGALPADSLIRDVRAKLDELEGFGRGPASGV